MLVLTRKINDKIIIGDNITVQVLEVRGNQVRLGIDAPRDISVHREEIWQQIANGVEAPRKTGTED